MFGGNYFERSTKKEVRVTVEIKLTLGGVY
jgi:hypothetical protein